MVPEMETFAQRYGFQFICHAIGHANRKAGEERGFWTVETNFLPGRTFDSLEDLNAQGLQWATKRMEHRPVGKTGLIPAQASNTNATSSHNCHFTFLHLTAGTKPDTADQPDDDEQPSD